MNNVLMITPFFAPYSHAAVYRAHRFAKYLPRFGWKPYVITVDRSLLYFIDNALLDDLPKEVEIIRAAHPDFTYSGFKALFRKPVAGSRSVDGPTSSDLTAKLEREDKNNFVKGMIDKFMDNFIFLPDRYITWYPFALKKAEEIMDSGHIDAIYSTATPFIPHLIAMRLKRRFKIPWIADFRDPGVEEERSEFHSSRFKYKLNCMIEKKIMKEADFILTTCNGAKGLFLSKYDKMVSGKIACIRHGTDTEILEGAKPIEGNKKFTIIFTGEFLPQYSRIFFEILKTIFEKKLFERNDVEVLIIGSIKRNIVLKKEIETFGLTDVVRLVDYLSLNTYFGALLSADATLMAGVFKYTSPIKLPDYLFVKKPVITFNANDEMRNDLGKSGLGLFMPDGIEEGIEALLGLLRGEHKFDINEDYINQFSAFNQTRELSDVLARLIEKR